jgi:hypothetical protein
MADWNCEGAIGANKDKCERRFSERRNKEDAMKRAVEWSYEVATGQLYGLSRLFGIGSSF